MIKLTDEFLLNYKRCNRRTYLEVYGSHEQKDPQKEFLLKLRKENKHHTQNFIQSRSLNPTRLNSSAKTSSARYQETFALMQSGAEAIFQGLLVVSFADWQAGINNENLKPKFTLESQVLESQTFESQISQPQSFLGTETPTNENKLLEPWLTAINSNQEDIKLIARPTLLIKQPGKSIFGDWMYTPINVKLGRRPKPEYKLIGAYHAQILAIIQNIFPDQSSLILRKQNEHRINLAHWLYRTREIVASCLEMLHFQAEPEVFISRQKCSLCQWHSSCYREAKASNHLSLVPGVTPKRYESLKKVGLDSLESIAQAGDRRSDNNLGKKVGQDIAKQLQQQARSILLNTALIRSDFDLKKIYQLPSADYELYFDIEAEPDRNLDYLLGILLVDRRNQTKKFYPFLAEQEDQEQQIWSEFVEFVSQYTNAPIFHFSGYEVDTIRRLSGLYGTPNQQTKALLSRCIDIHHWVTKSVILPVESYSLKSLANWLGFEWRESTASGDQSVCWYDNWLTTQDRALLDLILRYNEDDCYATFYLKDWLEKFFRETQQNQVFQSKV